AERAVRLSACSADGFRPDVGRGSVMGYWTDGELPANTRVAENTVITANYAFKRFRSRRDPALIVGSDCTMDGVHFALAKTGGWKLATIATSLTPYCYASWKSSSAAMW